MALDGCQCALARKCLAGAAALEGLPTSTKAYLAKGVSFSGPQSVCVLAFGVVVKFENR